MNVTNNSESFHNVSAYVFNQCKEDNDDHINYHVIINYLRENLDIYTDEYSRLKLEDLFKLIETTGVDNNGFISEADFEIILKKWFLIEQNLELANNEDGQEESILSCELNESASTGLRASLKTSKSLTHLHIRSSNMDALLAANKLESLPLSLTVSERKPYGSYSGHVTTLGGSATNSINEDESAELSNEEEYDCTSPINQPDSLDNDCTFTEDIDPNSTDDPFAISMEVAMINRRAQTNNTNSVMNQNCSAQQVVHKTLTSPSHGFNEDTKENIQVDIIEDEEIYTADTSYPHSPDKQKLFKGRRSSIISFYTESNRDLIDQLRQVKFRNTELSDINKRLQTQLDSTEENLQKLTAQCLDLEKKNKNLNLNCRDLGQLEFKLDDVQLLLEDERSNCKQLRTEKLMLETELITSKERCRDLYEKLTKMEDHIEEKEGEIKQLEYFISEQKTSNVKINQLLDEKDEEIDNNIRNMNELSKSIEDYQDSISALMKEKEQLEQIYKGDLIGNADSILKTGDTTDHTGIPDYLDGKYIDRGCIPCPGYELRQKKTSVLHRSSQFNNQNANKMDSVSSLDVELIPELLLDEKLGLSNENSPFCDKVFLSELGKGNKAEDDENEDEIEDDDFENGDIRRKGKMGSGFEMLSKLTTLVNQVRSSLFEYRGQMEATRCDMALITSEIHDIGDSSSFAASAAVVVDDEENGVNPLQSCDSGVRTNSTLQQSTYPMVSFTDEVSLGYLASVDKSLSLLSVCIEKASRCQQHFNNTFNLMNERIQLLTKERNQLNVKVESLEMELKRKSGTKKEQMAETNRLNFLIRSLKKQCHQHFAVAIKASNERDYLLENCTCLNNTRPSFHSKRSSWKKSKKWIDNLDLSHLNNKDSRKLIHELLHRRSESVDQLKTNQDEFTQTTPPLTKRSYSFAHSIDHSEFDLDFRTQYYDGDDGDVHRTDQSKTMGYSEIENRDYYISTDDLSYDPDDQHRGNRRNRYKIGHKQPISHSRNSDGTDSKRVDMSSSIELLDGIEFSNASFDENSWLGNPNLLEERRTSVFAQNLDMDELEDLDSQEEDSQSKKKLDQDENKLQIQDPTKEQMNKNNNIALDEVDLPKISTEEVLESTSAYKQRSESTSSSSEGNTPNEMDKEREREKLAQDVDLLSCSLSVASGSYTPGSRTPVPNTITADPLSAQLSPEPVRKQSTRLVPQISVLKPDDDSNESNDNISSQQLQQQPPQQQNVEEETRNLKEKSNLNRRLDNTSRDRSTSRNRKSRRPHTVGGIISLDQPNNSIEMSGDSNNNSSGAIDDKVISEILDTIEQVKLLKDSLSSLSSNELLDKFKEVSLEYETDRKMLEQRSKDSSFKFNTAFTNVEQEFAVLRRLVKEVSMTACTNSTSESLTHSHSNLPNSVPLQASLSSSHQTTLASSDLLPRIKSSINVLEKCVEYLSAKSETLGSVEKELRLCRVTDVMFAYCQSLKEQNENLKKNLDIERHTNSENQAIIDANMPKMSGVGSNNKKDPKRRFQDVALKTVTQTNILRHLSTNPAQPFSGNNSCNNPPMTMNPAMMYASRHRRVGGIINQSSFGAGQPQQMFFGDDSSSVDTDGHSTTASSGYYGSEANSNNNNVMSMTSLQKGSVENIIYNRGLQKGLKLNRDQALNELRDQQSRFASTIDQFSDLLNEEDEEYEQNDDINQYNSSINLDKDGIKHEIDDISGDFIDGEFALPSISYARRGSKVQSESLKETSLKKIKCLYNGTLDKIKSVINSSQSEDQRLSVNFSIYMSQLKLYLRRLVFVVFSSLFILGFLLPWLLSSWTSSSRSSSTTSSFSIPRANARPSRAYDGAPTSNNDEPASVDTHTSPIITSNILPSVKLVRKGSSTI